MEGSADLVNAEEIIIQQQLTTINSIEELMHWARENFLHNHPLVRRRRETLQTEEDERILNEDTHLLMDMEMDMEIDEEEVLSVDPIKCQTCSKTFSTKQNMDIHMDSVHRKRKFSCSICNKAFAYNNSRIRHERAGHNSTMESSSSKKRRIETDGESRRRPCSSPSHNSPIKRTRVEESWRPTPAPRKSIRRLSDESKPAPHQPTPAPRQPTPAPRRPLPAPRQPTPTPLRPIPAPRRPTLDPCRPTPAPRQPIPDPCRPTPAPRRPTPAPRQAIPDPCRPTPAPRRPTPAPRQPTPAPGRPIPAPRLSLQAGTSREQNRVADKTDDAKGKKGYKCRQCTKTLPDRRQLYLHRQLAHGQLGGSAALQPAPWGEQRPPWLDGHDMELEQVYRANERFILAPDNPDSVRATFNLPVNDNPDISQIEERVRQIYSQQEHAFRINFMFGLVLRHTETGDLRYFIPDQNESLFPQPLLINRARDINGKLRRRLEGVDVGEHLSQFRPDSKWKLYFITNVKIVIYKTNYLLGAGAEEVPDYVQKNANICSLTKNGNGRSYNDNLCAFRCLALFRGQRTQLERTTKSLYRQWTEYVSEREMGDLTHVRPESYAGVNLGEMDEFEKCFKTNINIYTLDKDGIATPVRRTMSRYEDTLYVNLFGHHLSYISNVKAYAKKYQCRNCEHFFNTAWQCVRHEKTCDKQTTSKYPGGFHSARETIFDQLDEFGILVAEEDRFYPWFAVYDFEALLQQTDETDSGKLQWTTEHVPISVSICSNVAGFEEPICLVDPDTGDLVLDMIKRLEEIQETAHALATEKWKYVFEEIDEQINQWKEYDGPVGTMMINAFTKLKTSMEQYCCQLIVLGFNSARYDLNLIKKHIAKHLRMDEKEAAGFTVKKQNSYLCISNAQLKFLDISQFLSPGAPYSKFLSAYDVHETKGFFPYEYMTTTDKLLETALPPHSEFYSKLKGKNISEEEYAYCQRIWEEENMQTLQDLLVWYNNLDVGPFVKAVEKLQKFYFDRKIDIFKVAMSVPGVARQMLFRASRDAGASFSLFGETDKDLYSTIKDNVVGGPSIIFNRYSAAGETCIRNNPDKPCGRVLGYDANALYLWALDQPMPTSTFVRRKRETNFHPEARDRYMSAYYWMDWMSQTTGRRIDHKLNSGHEKRIGAFPVDGYCSETNAVFQFQGCYHHGHECYLTRHVKDQDKDGQKKKFEKTTNTTAFLMERGYAVTEIWECQYRNLVNDCEILREFINERKPKFFRSHKGTVTESQILRAVKEETLFGMVECDIKVPDQWATGFEQERSPYEYFSEMAPIFCNTDIPFSVIGEHMRDHVRESKLSDKPRRLLIGGMAARKMLIATPLLKWYIDHGMQVEHIYQVVEYTPMACFREFVTDVTEARRRGDNDKSSVVIADTMKLIGNSAYGGLIMDKSKHTNIKYVRGDTNASNAVNNPRFKDLDRLDEDIFEVQNAKRTITYDLPIQLGYFILQYAKLRMLEYYYDFMDVFVDRSDFAYCEMDTDSAYMAISGKRLEDIIKVDKRKDYDDGLFGYCHVRDIQADNSVHWFPRKCCADHEKRDKRTPGLFKLEYEGDRIVSLSSKTYCVAKDDDIKFSAKGVQRKNIENNAGAFKLYEDVLKTKETKSAVNIGFRARNNTVFTYQQEKRGFTYFYCKREVLSNGIDTKVLDIVLCPEKKDPKDVRMADILCELMDE